MSWVDEYVDEYYSVEVFVDVFPLSVIRWGLF